jgi:transposase InsO family protein
MQDATADGRMLKILTVVDEFTRESKAIAVDRRMPAVKVIEVLYGAFAESGVAEYLRSDNGPEVIAEAVQTWLSQRGTKTHYIAPASPWQNAFGESFNDKLRTECLNLEVFETLAEAKVVLESGAPGPHEGAYAQQRLAAALQGSAGGAHATGGPTHGALGGPEEPLQRVGRARDARVVVGVQQPGPEARRLPSPRDRRSARCMRPVPDAGPPPGDG